MTALDHEAIRVLALEVAFLVWLLCEDASEGGDRGPQACDM